MSRRWTLSLLLIAFGLFYLLPMATHGLWIPDETRYAQISQEVLGTLPIGQVQRGSLQGREGWLGVQGA
ncbi:hypothetical protein AO265_02210 [Pseudomonas sp. ABAC61]|nr:hypothetical protein AO265_02210 [Pseudomonas sp. ABAC61]